MGKSSPQASGGKDRYHDLSFPRSRGLFVRRRWTVAERSGGCAHFLAESDAGQRLLLRLRRGPGDHILNFPIRQWNGFGSPRKTVLRRVAEWSNTYRYPPSCPPGHSPRQKLAANLFLIALDLMTYSVGLISYALLAQTGASDRLLGDLTVFSPE